MHDERVKQRSTASKASKLRYVNLSVSNKLMRMLWNIVWLLLYRPSPVPLHAWRALLLRLFGAKIGVKLRIYPSAKIWAPWNLVMEDGSCIGPYVDCYSVDFITICEKATVSQYSYLCTASHDYTSRQHPLVTAPITVRKNAWVTADVFIGPGVTVGEGAVVGSRSVVLSDVAPWVVVAGNPAVLKKKRVLRD